MRDYEDSGHMIRVPVNSNPSNQCVYLPHHSVLREASVTTHLRVVFNASSVTSNGTSLNDHLLSGPKLQTDIASVIIKWRQHKFVYAADIAQMYRQIRVDPRDLSYQRVLWKGPKDNEPIDYNLMTVTYGMTCAPFLALRVLRQLTLDEGQHYSAAVSVLRESTYVDDVLFGGTDKVGVRRTRDELSALLGRGGFRLRKWLSNASELLSDLDVSDHGLACQRLLATDERIKILGIAWNPSGDTFGFSAILTAPVPSSKRAILSAIAKLYDPLGWVTPVIITAKIFMQQLWRTKIEWDEPIVGHPYEKWTSIYTDLSHLSELRVPRWTERGPASDRVEIHGFSDASNLAYAAVVYMRVRSTSGAVAVTLLASKSKVAPLKPLTIPRLELCAAVLLARLVAFICQSLGDNSIPCHCWTDSTIALAWMSKHPSAWRTFVANRVAEIKTRIPNASWRHVPTADNPADCASRGLLGAELVGHTLWWRGPPWLKLKADKWPAMPAVLSDDTPLERKVIVLQCSTASVDWDLSTRYSSWPKLLRVTAYILRFVRSCHRNRKSSVPSTKGTALFATGISAAKTLWLKRIQAELFPEEIHALQGGRSVASRSPLISLNPFLDRNQILRVGGRLRNAPLSFAVRHPVVLAAYPLVKLIISQAHLRALHAGPQLTASVLRRDYWILRSRSIIRSIIHNCVRCVRERASFPSQLMGDLPAARVSATTKCFSHCGIDYAGPVRYRPSAGRGVASRKAYIALFICLATRAIHLELVGDLSTPAFVNAYSRFCARRGLPQCIYSDNGTTFVGADRELTRLYRAAIRDPNFQNSIASDNVEWRFIPPSAPHFGGLWEAGVRSVKYHLRRVLASHTPSFEEFSTLLCRIEACLNSRPIAPLYESFDNCEPLTPGHFFIGQALALSPEPSILELDDNRLLRWQLVQHATEKFWKLWQNDYVNTLQQRTKWRTVRPPIRVGQLVLLHNATLLPCKWELGRVTKCHPGSDGLVCVVTVKTAASEYRRPIGKVCVLPVTSATTSDSATM